MGDCEPCCRALRRELALFGVEHDAAERALDDDYDSKAQRALRPAVPPVSRSQSRERCPLLPQSQLTEPRPTLTDAAQAALETLPDEADAAGCDATIARVTAAAERLADALRAEARGPQSELPTGVVCARVCVLSETHLFRECGVKGPFFRVKTTKNSQPRKTRERPQVHSWRTAWLWRDSRSGSAQGTRARSL